MDIPFLVAQVDQLAGASGWAGAGLLGAVLAWLLLKHLPMKDAQIERLIAAHDVEVAKIVTESRADFRETLDHILERNDQRTALLAQAVSKDLELMQAGVLAALKNGLYTRRLEPPTEPLR